MGNLKPYYGKSNFYKKKKETLLKKIDYHQAAIEDAKAEIEVCDEEIAKEEAEA